MIPDTMRGMHDIVSYPIYHEISVRARKNILNRAERLRVPRENAILCRVMEKTSHVGTRIVLLFVRPCFHSHRERIRGVYAAAMKCGWHVQQIDAEPTSGRLRADAKMWRPIGCLIDPSVMTRKLDPRALNVIPTVLMGRGGAELKWDRFDYSAQDSKSPVTAAISELTRLGLKNFAFFGDPAQPYWSVERGRFFKENLPRNATFSEYDGPNPSTVRGRKAAAKWLRSQPRPCGCLLAADHMATAFYAAAEEAELAIGTDLPTLGVDNDERICLSLSPTLSSVQLDMFMNGVNAVRLLERRLANPSLPPQRITYGAIGVVRRVSTSPIYRDWRATKGVAFVNAHGCDRITINDVAREMGCCRRLAENLFRRHVGVSILDAIRKIRIEKAYALLRNNSVPVDAIPFQCGYASSPAYMKTYFKRVTGMTMREWRRKNCQI